jgi:ornithine cyclodeaminase/alanine dehydrogenase-like protein (mu-crystallin family)
MKMLYLTRADVERVALPMPDIIQSLERMFLEKGMGRTEMPPKPGIHPQTDAFIHAMPAFIPSMAAAGIKWISGFPENVSKGLPYISGLIVLNDVETGIPLCVMDATWVTAKRTGAATAVAAKYLARPEANVVGILGCGVQGYSNLEALRCLFPLAYVRAYDLNPEKSLAYKDWVETSWQIPVEIATSPEQTVRRADLVVTAGPILKHPTPVIEDDWLAPGAFASPVDYDSYWKPEAFAQADKVFTDDIAQLEYNRGAGYFQHFPTKLFDLGDLVAGKIPGRENDAERIFSVNLGLALDDMATAPLIYRRALELGIGIELDL